LQPNFAECWWDHWVLDFAICNTLGIVLGELLLRYLNSRTYSWVGLDETPTIRGKALRALSRPIVYSCSWPAYLGGNESAKPFDQMIAAGCNLWRNWDDIQCSWGSLSSIIEHWGEYSEALEPVARPGHWNDPDMLLIGATKPDGSPCVSLEEERTQMAIWALTASPLIMGNDARNITEGSREILLNKGAIAVDQDALGVPGRRLVAGRGQKQLRGLSGKGRWPKACRCHDKTHPNRQYARLLVCARSREFRPLPALLPWRRLSNRFSPFACIADGALGQSHGSARAGFRLSACARTPRARRHPRCIGCLSMAAASR
jgi:hypothetical protein